MGGQPTSLMADPIGFNRAGCFSALPATPPWIWITHKSLSWWSPWAAPDPRDSVGFPQGLTRYPKGLRQPSPHLLPAVNCSKCSDEWEHFLSHVTTSNSAPVASFQGGFAKCLNVEGGDQKQRECWTASHSTDSPLG